MSRLIYIRKQEVKKQNKGKTITTASTHQNVKTTVGTFHINIEVQTITVGFSCTQNPVTGGVYGMGVNSYNCKYPPFFSETLFYFKLSSYFEDK